MNTSVAIVTGGGRGIGRAIVERLARRGHTVLAVSRSPLDPAPQAATDGPVVAFECDITAQDSPARIFDAAELLGDVTILVNNAGVTGPIGPLRAAHDDDIQGVIDVNLTAVMRLSREAIARWAARPPTAERSIVNVTSIAARTGAPGEYTWYAASKAGAEAFTVGLAKEVGGERIRVNAVSPGTTDTGIHARAGRPDRAAEVARRVPFGRVADPDEIAAAVEWLTTADASYISGAVIPVTGGS